MLEKLQIVKQRFDEVSDLIIQPDIMTDQKRYIALNKEYKELKVLVEKREEYMTLMDNLAEAEEIISEGLFEFQHIFQMREVEIAMRAVPQKVKEIKNFAVTEVFKNELDGLDDNSRDVLDKVLEYMEKKYMSVPMLMAKEILLKNNAK